MLFAGGSDGVVLATPTNGVRPAGAEAPTGREGRGTPGQRTRTTTFLSFDFAVKSSPR
jgi:hypothetical protein